MHRLVLIACALAALPTPGLAGFVLKPTPGGVAGHTTPGTGITQTQEGGENLSLVMRPDDCAAGNVTTHQAGHGNFAIVTQCGAGSWVTIIQGGSGNTARINQH
jgi:hypothetical protein